MDQANSTNPYAAPAVASRRRRTPPVEHWPLKYLFVGTVILTLLMVLAIRTVASQLTEAASALGTSLGLMRFATYLAWVNLTWQQIPTPLRGGTTPRVAVLWMVFPPIGLF
jgi:hypothetical protein